VAGDAVTADDPVRRGDAIGFARAVGAEGVAYSIERMPASALHVAALRLARAVSDKHYKSAIVFIGECDCADCGGLKAALAAFREAEGVANG